MYKKYYPVYAILVLVGILVTSSIAIADGVPRMTVDDLNSRLDKGDVAVLDVRSDRDWNSAHTSIPGSARVNPDEIGQWAKSLPEGQAIVLYCA